MKKLIIIIGVLSFLGVSIVLGTMTAQNVYESNHDYVGYDVVSDSDESGEKSNSTNQTVEEIDTDQTVADSKEDKTVTSETDNNNEPDTNSKEPDTDTTQTDTEQTDLSQTDTNTIDSATNSMDSEIKESDTDTQTDTSDISSDDDTSEIKITEQNTSEEDDAQEAIEAALNITNPSIDIDASSAILLDSNTGKVLFHKNATSKVYPASTTKLVTALVALDYCELDEVITIGSEVTYIASDSSRAYLRQGEILTLQMLLEGMLIPSGNDAAYAIATYVGRISLSQKVDNRTAIEEFVRLMNKKVSDLGLKSTHFINPDGYDADGQYTTAYDMGIIAIEALKNETIREITSMSSASNLLISGESITWNSSNKLIVSGSGEYYKYAIGLKTGSSSLAGKCLVSAAEKDGSTYVSVVMNSTSIGRWEDSIALLQYGIEQ